MSHPERVEDYLEHIADAIERAIRRRSGNALRGKAAALVAEQTLTAPEFYQLAQVLPTTECRRVLPRTRLIGVL